MNNSQFDKFVGRKVLVIETSHTMFLRALNKDIDYLECNLDPSETVVADLEKESGNSNIRVWLPGTMGTMDYRSDRLNIHILKQADGSFQVDRVIYG